MKPTSFRCSGEHFPKEFMGTGIVVWKLLYELGAIMVHWITGILRDSKGVYYHAFMIDAGMAAAGLFLISLTKKRKAS